MDALSNILDNLELAGSLYFPTVFRAPFGLAVPADSNACRFHVVVEGQCVLSVGQETVRLERGDLALVPHGLGHELRDAPTTAVVDLGDALERSGYPGTGIFEWGEGPDTCRLVCGFFGFDEEWPHPLLDALPPIVHLKATETYNFRWIDQVMRFMGEEMHSQRPGGELIARRLSEILFVQVVRHFAETAAEPVPVLAAVTDPRLSRALHGMHVSPQWPWTLDTLASEAAMSRTAFTNRFTELIGTTPMKYLKAHRMRVAGKWLRSGQRTSSVAEQVGYQSEAAFSRAFKGTYGVGPGTYRRTHRAA